MEGQPRPLTNNPDGNEKGKGTHTLTRKPTLGLGVSKKSANKQEESHNEPHNEPLSGGDAHEVLLKAKYPPDIITVLQQMNVIAFRQQQIEYESQITQLKAEHEVERRKLRSDYNIASQSRDHEQRANQRLMDLLNERAKEAQENMSKATAEHAEQKRSLEEKIFELAGGVECASEGAMKFNFEAVVTKISSQVPNMFREADQSNQQHRQILNYLGGKGDVNYLRFLDEYGPDVWYHICSMLVFDSIWREIEQKFCIGADEAIYALDQRTPPGASIDHALRVVENVGIGRDEEGKAYYSVYRLAAQTIRLLLLLADVDLRKASEGPESREKVLKKAPSLKTAIDRITQAAIWNFLGYTLRGESDSPDKQTQRLYKAVFPWASELTFLWLNTRLSGKDYSFRRYGSEDEVNPEFMKVVFSNQEAEGEIKKRSSFFSAKTAQRVALTVYPAFIKPGGICLFRAGVIARTASPKSTGLKGYFSN
ncbi:MAG: hypothetical protein M1840_001535 [Geoglossum simile]|nr:MAG: hypothetical protein M1840_001535 [Geoglossum simile]